jgi:hypothetical protein
MISSAIQRSNYYTKLTSNQGYKLICNDFGGKDVFCSRKLYREKLLVNVEQAPSPAFEKNSRGRLFHIF